MKQMLFCNPKVFLLWIILNFLISGCGAKQESTLVAPTQSPSPRAIPTSSFGLGDIASIARQDAANLSNEEIVKVLVSQWLEGYKTDTSSKEAIIDYKIEEIFIQNHPTDSDPGIIAIVTFAIQPIGYSDNWGSLIVQLIAENDPWWHLGATFSIVPDGEYFRLRTAFGWGT